MSMSMSTMSMSTLSMSTMSMSTMSMFSNEAWESRKRCSRPGLVVHNQLGAVQRHHRRVTILQPGTITIWIFKRFSIHNKQQYSPDLSSRWKSCTPWQLRAAAASKAVVAAGSAFASSNSAGTCCSRSRSGSRTSAGRCPRPRCPTRCPAGRSPIEIDIDVGE